VLFFDEADVLFAKRTEVKDAHDRYANVEVAYLLQRMEDYDGLAILTTNLKQNIDTAFLRRLRFVVDFPMPDAEQRERIWMLAFPGNAPLGDNVDFKFLARRLTLTGGNIQQIAIRAAFAAAADSINGPVITMQHIVRATRQELLKLGMLGAEQSLAQMAVDRNGARKEASA
jgi:SpoVK/Ycf46/Vps4 family AAA+-type ATPase